MQYSLTVMNHPLFAKIPTSFFKNEMDSHDGESVEYYSSEIVFDEETKEHVHRTHANFAEKYLKMQYCLETTVIMKITTKFACNIDEISINTEYTIITEDEDTYLKLLMIMA